MIRTRPRPPGPPGGTSSTCVAIDHTWPNGSATVPKRSPQNWSATSILIVPPASTARFTTASTSSTYMKTLALVPPSCFGGCVDACGNGSDSITSESPTSSSAWPILPSGVGMRTRSVARNAFL
jgi:hypothetical protein